MKAWSPYTEVFVACFNRDLFETLRRSLIRKMLFDTPNTIILFLASIFYLLPISRLYNVQKSYIHRPCASRCGKLLAHFFSCVGCLLFGEIPEFLTSSRAAWLNTFCLVHSLVSGEQFLLTLSRLGRSGLYNSNLHSCVARTCIRGSMWSRDIKHFPTDKTQLISACWPTQTRFLYLLESVCPARHCKLG